MNFMPREFFGVDAVQTDRCRQLVVCLLSGAVTQHFNELKGATARALELLPDASRREVEGRVEAAMRSGVDRLTRMEEQAVALLERVDRSEAEHFAAAVDAEHSAAVVEACEHSKASKQRRALSGIRAADYRATRSARDAVKVARSDVADIRSPLILCDEKFGATRWFLSDSDEPMSFLWCAELLGFSPARIRSRLFTLSTFENGRQRAAEARKAWERVVAVSETYAV